MNRRQASHAKDYLVMMEQTDPSNCLFSTPQLTAIGDISFSIKYGNF